jgi:hypothetical protein
MILVACWDVVASGNKVATKDSPRRQTGWNYQLLLPKEGAKSALFKRKIGEFFFEWDAFE